MAFKGAHNYWSITVVWQGYLFISIFELGRLWAWAAFYIHVQLMV